MANSEVLKLSLLLELKNNASPGVLTFTADLKKLDAQGKTTLGTLEKIRRELNRTLRAKGLLNLEKELAMSRTAPGLHDPATPGAINRFKSELNEKLRQGHDLLDEQFLQREPTPAKRTKAAIRDRHPDVEAPLAVDRFVGPVQDKLVSSAVDTHAALTMTQRDVASTAAKIKDMGDDSAVTSRKFEKMNETLDTQKRKLNDVSQAYVRGEISTKKYETAVSQANNKVASLNSRLKDAQARMKDPPRRAAQAASPARSVFSGALGALGVVGLASSLRTATVEGMNLTMSLDKLARFTSTLDEKFQTPQALDRFKKDIVGLSMELPHSAESIAQASFQIKSAYQDISEPELINFLREFGRAATASNTDIATHAFNMAALAKQYNVAGKDLPQFFALMSTAFGNALATDEKVSAGFNRILASAKSTRQPLADMAAAMSTLQSASSDAESNTTLLQNVYSKLTDPKYIKGIEKLGIAFYDAQGNARPLNDLVNDMATKLKGLNDQEINDKLGFAKDQQAREGLKALIRLVEVYNKTLKEGGDTGRYAAKTDFMLDSIDARWDKFEKKLTNIKTLMGGVVLQAFEDADSLMGREVRMSGWFADPKGKQKTVRIPPPTLSAADWAQVIGDSIRIAMGGAVQTRIPQAKASGTQIGNAMSSGIAFGIGSGEAGVISAAAALFSAAVDASKNTASTGGIDVGSAMASGIAFGIGSGESGVISAAVNVAYNAYLAAKAALGIHSPSKVFFDLGQDVDRGFLEGIESMKPMAQAAIAGLVDTSGLDTSGLVDLFDIHAKPHITPGPDLVQRTREVFIAAKRPEGIASDIGTRELRQRAPELANPEVMTTFRHHAMPKMELPEADRSSLDQLLKQAFPASFAESLSGITQQGKTLAETLSSIQVPIAPTRDSFAALQPAVQPIPQTFADIKPPVDSSRVSLIDLYTAARPVPPNLLAVNAAAISVSESLNIVSQNLAAWRPPAAPSIASPGGQAVNILNPPPFAGGAENITRSGLAMVHSNERIVPAKARAFHDELGQKLVSTVVMLKHREREQRQPSVYQFFNSAPTSTASTSITHAAPSLAVPGFATGTDRVTDSGLAFIHADERIVPAKAQAYRDRTELSLISKLVEMRSRETRVEKTSFVGDREQNLIRNLTQMKFAGDRSTVNNFSLPHARTERPYQPTIRPEPVLNIPAAGSRGKSQVTVTFGETHFHFKGTAPEAIREEFPAMLENHRRTIVGLVREELDRREDRA